MAIAESPAPPPLAEIQIGAPGRQIPSNFMGLSHEWGDSRNFLGSASVGRNLIYRQLIANLTAYGNGPIELRIGGDSTDATKEPTPAFIAPFADVARDTGAHFILGVNLAAGDPQLAVRQAKFYLSLMPPGSVDAIEVGNEPDLYTRHGRRDLSFSISAYLAEIDQWRKALLPVLPPGVKLAGPAWNSYGFGSVFMHSHLDEFEKRQQGALGVFTWHYYQTSPQSHPGPDYFLDSHAATDGPDQVQSVVQLSHANGIPFRAAEINSINGVGVHGASDDFATALWAIDTMFEYLRVGVDGVNWEASDGNYDNPFYFSVNQSVNPNTFSLKYVSPLYCGLLFFQAATGNRARMLAVSLHTPEKVNLKVWATLDGTDAEHIVVINKDKYRGGEVVFPSGGRTQATVRRLLAPSPESTSNVTFAGQSFDGSKDGRPLGAPQVEKLNCSRQSCSVPVPPASAALVTLAY